MVLLRNFTFDSSTSELDAVALCLLPLHEVEAAMVVKSLMGLADTEVGSGNGAAHPAGTARLQWQNRTGNGSRRGCWHRLRDRPDNGKRADAAVDSGRVREQDTQSDNRQDVPVRAEVLFTVLDGPSTRKTHKSASGHRATATPLTLGVESPCPLSTPTTKPTRAATERSG